MAVMRVLTVRQPWAWAIIHGYKDVENRVRNIAGAYRGPVAIHASKSGDYGALNDPALAAAIERHMQATGEAWRYVDLPRGVILGVVDLTETHAYTPSVGCHDTNGKIQMRKVMCSPWAQPGNHHLRLEHPRPLAEPIPYVGALGMRRLDEDTIHAIKEQLAREDTDK